MTNLNMNTQRSEITLSEEYVQDCFHSYLKSSLAQVKAEGLLDITVLSSAESDLMITGTHLFHHNHSSWIIFERLWRIRPRSMSLFRCFAICDRSSICATTQAI